ncbi:hypothetical protein CTEN210_03823 [Chaetoceros tenuissimus]|uniref:Uncharacterized protein n=1 Tax=Chaetoceros tenuissimus TaxID=426638 RepID=A0AAD3CK19_9STRA|nr:hypothetical protein CTEN210_03823 [Chaetoceros tenuissimus]
MDKYIKHICEVIDLGTRKLKGAKIVSIDALISSKQSMHEEGFAGLTKNARSDLLTVIRLLESWRREGKTDEAILNEFTEEEFERFCIAADDKARNQAEEEERKLRHKIRDEIIIEEKKREELIDLMRKPFDERYSILRPQDERSLNDFIQKCIEDIMTDKLRASCSIYKELITKSLIAIDELAGTPDLLNNEEYRPQQMVIAGRTQSGKSSVKGVVQSMCGLLKMPLIVLTKGVDESIDLHQKHLSFSEGTKMAKEHIHVASGRRDGHSAKAKTDLIDIAFGSEHGGTLLIADTEAQVKKACTAIEQYRVKVPNGKFILIVDEADAMYRTPAKEQKFEKALQNFLDMNAALEIYISASPVPLIIELMYGDNKRPGHVIALLNLEPNEEYVSIDDMKTLAVNRKGVYLKQNELTKNSVIEGIPYANEKVLHLYDDALSNPENQKGVLVLDCSCPRTIALCNITDKANAVQKYYGNQRKDVVVITFTGKGISVRFPNEIWDTDTWKKKTISEVLEHIDANAESGLKMPVFIFGFAKMCRGISFRSAKRVPTHMIVSLGRAHNSCNVLQTIGRATFNGKSILIENGFETVTLLSTRSDFHTSREMQKFINEVHRRMNEEGNTLAEALAGSNEKFPHALNFVLHTFREIGKQKGQRELFRERIPFEEAPMELNSLEEEVKEMIWDDFNAQAVLRSIARLSRGNNHNFDRDDIIHDIEEVEEIILKKKQANQVLRSFCDNTIIDKDKKNSTKHAIAYRVHSPKRLKLFMNEEMGDIPKSDDEEETSDSLLEEEENQGDSISETDSSLSINEVEEDSASQHPIQMVSIGRPSRTPIKCAASSKDNIRAVSQDTAINESPLGSDFSSPSENHTIDEEEDAHIVTQDTTLPVQIQTQDTMRKGSTGFKRIQGSTNRTRSDLHHKKKRRSSEYSF